MNCPPIRGPTAILSFQPEAGSGSEVVLEELLNAWDGDRGDLLIVTPPGRVESAAHAAGFRTIHFPGDPGRSRDAAYNGRVFMGMAGGFPPVASVFAWTARAFPAAASFGRASGIPAGGTLHDNPMPSRISVSLRSPLKMWRYPVIWWEWQGIRRAANAFQRMVAVSRAVKGDCLKYGYRTPIQVIHNGIRDLKPKRARSEDGIVHVGFLGMGAGARTGARHVRAWVEATAPGMPLRWHLYGAISREDRKWVERGVTRGNVVAHGHTSREEIYGSLDILVHASTLFDSLPTVLIEAECAGIPCVASNLGGAGEIIEEGASGFLFDPGRPQEAWDGLNRLVRDRELRNRFGAHARAIYEERFQVKRMVSDYRKLFSELQDA